MKVVITCPQEERINRIYQDYVAKLKGDYIEQCPKNGSDLFDEPLLFALQKIQKRLGGVLYKQLNAAMQFALKQEPEVHHKQWIAELLEYYYDPMYNYQLEKI